MGFHPLVHSQRCHRYPDVRILGERRPAEVSPAHGEVERREWDRATDQDPRQIGTCASCGHHACVWEKDTARVLPCRSRLACAWWAKALGQEGRLKIYFTPMHSFFRLHCLCIPFPIYSTSIIRLGYHITFHRGVNLRAFDPACRPLSLVTSVRSYDIFPSSSPVPTIAKPV